MTDLDMAEHAERVAQALRRQRVFVTVLICPMALAGALVTTDYFTAEIRLFIVCIALAFAVIALMTGIAMARTFNRLAANPLLKAMVDDERAVQNSQKSHTLGYLLILIFVFAIWCANLFHPLDIRLVLPFVFCLVLVTEPVISLLRLKG